MSHLVRQILAHESIDLFCLGWRYTHHDVFRCRGAGPLLFCRFGREGGFLLGCFGVFDFISLVLFLLFFGMSVVHIGSVLLGITNYIRAFSRL